MRSEKYRDALFLFLVILIVFAVYISTLDYDLIYDSKIYFKDNPLFQEEHPLSTAFKSAYSGRIGLADRGHYYRPLTTFTFLAEKKLWGLEGFNLRLINLVIFCLTIVGLFFLFKEQAEAEWFPFLGTGLFAFFPLNLDNVVWVVGRADLFLVLWGVLAIVCLQGYLKKGKYFLLFLSSLCYTLGILSKESSLFLLAILLIYEWVKTRKITPLYHAANLGVTVLFFFIKSRLLGSALFKITFFPGFLDNIKVAVATLGYYFKSMLLAYEYDVYIPIDSTVTPINIILGIVLFLALLTLFLYALKRKNLLIPLSFMGIFLFGQLPLIFFDTLIFRASSRFIIFPVIGLIWIFLYFLDRLKPLIRNITACALLLLFIPALIVNTANYRDEVSYWTKLSQAFPANGYILFQLADALFSKGDFRAIFVLNQSLQKKPRFSTFVHMALLYEEIEFFRGHYPQALQWLDRIKGVTSPRIRIETILRRAKIYLAAGDIEKVQSILADIKGDDEKRYHELLHEIYLGFELWDRAAWVERIMAERYPGQIQAEAKKLRQELSRADPNQKLAFFLKYHNYQQAVKILLSFPRTLKRDLNLARLYYISNQPDQGDVLLEEYMSTGANNSELLNTIGNFYLNNMMMPERALPIFKKSLEINPHQPMLLHLVHYLKQHTAHLNFPKKLKKYPGRLYHMTSIPLPVPGAHKKISITFCFIIWYNIFTMESTVDSAYKVPG